MMDDKTRFPRTLTEAKKTMMGPTVEGEGMREILCRPEQIGPVTIRPGTSGDRRSTGIDSTVTGSCDECSSLPHFIAATPDAARSMAKRHILIAHGTD